MGWSLLLIWVRFWRIEEDGGVSWIRLYLFM